MRNRSFFVVAILLVALSLTACDVEKQMDTMVDNPSFAEPLFGKFMARTEYQVRAMDTILADTAMRQVLLEKIAANEEYARSVAEQLMSDPRAREMVSQLLAEPIAEPEPAGQ